ncbi:protein OSCP1-like [Nematolebias whitei]|uniref:protein OSCP1-like n=1 Tax=Nematolebias whitei TaxID=451745 RepID=UPI00189A7C7C|nr:protein OSCP1-like [Nematolebias whitei]
MSVTTLPLLFINLGGEMLCVVERRLRAHNTSEDKSETGVWTETDRKRVMSDIVGTMCSRTFIDELLKPQQLFSHRTTKTVLTRLAHASIMRLNPASMDRLYELVVMAFKYQLLLCPRPKDLLLVSFNHLDSIRGFVRDTPAVLNQVDEAHRKLMEVYSTSSEGELQLLRQTLLGFVQDLHVRVSLFLRNHIQNPNGRFILPTSGPVPHGVQVPGLIRTFDEKDREVSRTEFQSGGRLSRAVPEGSFELSGDRVLTLGSNMYAADRPPETHSSTTPGVQLDVTPNLLAKEELNQLARLMGSMKTQNLPKGETGFRINLFPADQEEGEEEGAAGGAQKSCFKVISIQAVQDQQTTSELTRIAEEFADGQKIPDNPSSSKGDDLLALMDDL